MSSLIMKLRQVSINPMNQDIVNWKLDKNGKQNLYKRKSQSKKGCRYQGFGMWEFRQEWLF